MTKKLPDGEDQTAYSVNQDTFFVCTTFRDQGTWCSIFLRTQRLSAFDIS